MEFPDSPKLGGSGEFLHLKDNDVAVGVFAGHPYSFYSKWENNKTVKCDPSDPEARYRFRINFIVYNKDEKKYIPKIWEQGATVYLQLKEFNTDYDLEKTVVKIKRTGSDRNTAYTILPNPGRSQVSEAMAKQIEMIELLKLDNFGEDEGDKSVALASEPTFNSEEEIPF